MLTGIRHPKPRAQARHHGIRPPESILTSKRQAPDRFNTLTMFGNFRVSDRRSLLALCDKTGIVICDKHILKVQRSGYKGNFDSRRLIIVFLNSIIAKEFEKALRIKQKHCKYWKSVSFQTSYTHTEEHSSNPYAL